MKRNEIVILVLAASLAGCAHKGAGTAAAPATGTTTTEAADTGGGGQGANPQMEKFAATHPGAAALVRSVMSLRILLRSEQHPLNPDQAARIVGLLKPVPAMKTLPQADAQRIATAIQGNLTPAQQEEIGLLRRSRGRRGGGRGRGGAGGAGGGAAGGSGGGAGGASQRGGANGAAAGGPGGGMSGGFGGGPGSPGGGGGPGGFGGGMGGPGGGRNMGRFLDPNAPPDANIFQQGPLKRMIGGIVDQLQTAQQV